jgi:hypothetical protein
LNAVVLVQQPRSGVPSGAMLCSAMNLKSSTAPRPVTLTFDPSERPQRNAGLPGFEYDDVRQIHEPLAAFFIQKCYECWTFRHRSSS